MFPSGMTSIDMKNVKSIEQFADSAVLGEPQKLLRAVFNAPTVGLAILDRRLRFRAVNNALGSINGVPPEAHLGKTIRGVLGKAAVALEPPFKHVFSNGREVSNLEVCAKLPNRPEVGYWIENYFPLRDAAGRVQQVAAVVVEITEQKKLQQSLCSVTEMLFRNLVLTVNNSEAFLRQFTQESRKQIPDSGANHDPSPVTGLSEVLEGRSESDVNAKVGVVPLTPREREVVKLLADGRGNKGTAAILGVSVKTIEAHRQRIMLKLGVHTATGLLHYAVTNKILDPEHMGHV